MSEQNKALVRRFYEEVFNRGNLATLDELVPPGAVDHSPVPGQPTGREGVKQTITMIRTAFPDFKLTVEDLIAEGDKVAVRLTVRGTHKGEFKMGPVSIPPTGKQVSFTGMDILRVASGRIVERWGERDRLSTLQQLGVVPAPGQATAPRP